MSGDRFVSGARPSPKNWLRAYFDEGVIHFATTGERLSACDAASGFFYLAPTGDVFPCLTLNRMPQFLRKVTAQIRSLNPAIRVIVVDQ